MTGEEFIKVVEYYGEENIIGLGFDNSAASTFPEGHRFDMSTMYVPDIECVQLSGYDVRGNIYHTIKHVENIQTVIVRDSQVDISSYGDMTDIRS